jgi:TetR/AcrR family transcriptional repressor of nem operon
MSTRKQHKDASREKILHAAAARLRCEGLEGAGIQRVMKEAGLTHGAFYCHFRNKEDLASQAFEYALKDNRKQWISSQHDATDQDRFTRLAQRYLTLTHCDNVEQSCAFAAMASDAGRAGKSFKETFLAELLKTLQAITESDFHTIEQCPDEVIAFMALCVGGLTLARAMPKHEAARKILSGCLRAAPLMAQSHPPAPKTPHDSPFTPGVHNG